METAVHSNRIVYASNHKSHTDYLVEPLVLDDNGVRPPLIVAGINLFGGPLGLLHKHVTGAIPIRRATKDAAYLIIFKAYVAEVLKKHDLFFYPEGGRSYSGELKPSKTGLFIAALSAERPDLVLIPVAVAYALVLEDHILAHQQVKKRQRRLGPTVAKRVRTETRVANSAVSVSYAAVELAKKILGDLPDKTVMLIGAGEMSELAARHLLPAGATGILVTSRALERPLPPAQALPNRVHGHHLELATHVKPCLSGDRQFLDLNDTASGHDQGWRGLARLVPVLSRAPAVCPHRLGPDW